MDFSKCVSHTRDDGTKELVLTHLREVAAMAREFGAPMGIGSLAQTVGMYHDIGKFSKEFQRRILNDGPKVDHSAAGAYELEKQGFCLLPYCVAGHHGGLPDGGQQGDCDGGTLVGRMWKAADGDIPDYGGAIAQKLISSELPNQETLTQELQGVLQKGGNDNMGFSLAFLTRMVFSCLVDADFLCTERFMQGDSRAPVSARPLLDLAQRFEKRIEPFYPPRSHLNKLRCDVLDGCAEAAKSNPGVFSLTVPTGGGKTLSAMRFALQHACANGMRRVIVAEPYTSIIEQNAQVYREYLDAPGEENVLEHHSNFDFDEADKKLSERDVLDAQDPQRKSLRLASENWDMPIVITTNVQLLESMFASSTSKSRKLHNIANSVIVLDEAQMIPTHFLSPCIEALSELVKHYGCTVLLCTATQPALDGFFEKRGLEVREIVSNPQGLFKALERVSYKLDGKLEDDELVSRLVDHEQVLCILNSRAQARNVYEGVRNIVGEGAFHLSTLMCPVERESTLELIRERVAQSKPCRVVSTSLVEAGVDLDFPVVYRAMAGLDSIVQAAGRCNREGKRNAKVSAVHVFESGENPFTGRPYGTPSEVRHRAGVTEACLSESETSGDHQDLGSLTAIHSFFSHLYAYGTSKAVQDAFDKNEVMKDLEPSQEKTEEDESKALPVLSFAFRKADADFSLIDDISKPVIIPSHSIETCIDAVRRMSATRQDMRKVGRHCVSVYPNDIDSLMAAGAIEEIAEGLYLLTDESRYSISTGLNTRDEQGEAKWL